MVRKNQGDTRRNGSRTNEKVVSFSELNSRTVDPSLVRQAVVHYLLNPDRLTSYQFANLGMASSRHCDIHLVTKVCETVSVWWCCTGATRYYETFFALGAFSWTAPDASTMENLPHTAEISGSMG